MFEAKEKALAKVKAALDAVRNSKKTPEQIEKAKELYDSLDPGDRTLLEYIFPEVVESEDERIRRRLVEYFNGRADNYYFLGFSKRELLAWLEKQKEHFTPEEKMNHPLFLEGFDVGRQVGEVVAKPAEWSDSVAKEMFIKALERAVEQTKKGCELTDCDKHSWWEDFKAYSEIKPAEWSEEDEKMIERLIRHTQKEYDELCKDSFGHQEIISDLKESCRERMNWLEKRLKSLRPRPHWKPSEEQMNELRNAVSLIATPNRFILDELYSDLKKLM